MPRGNDQQQNLVRTSHSSLKVFAREKTEEVDSPFALTAAPLTLEERKERVRGIQVNRVGDLMGEFNVMDEMKEYKDEYKPVLKSAFKRKVKTSNKKSRLYAKNQNALAIEDVSTQLSEQRAAFMDKTDILSKIESKEEASALSAYLDESTAEKTIDDYSKGGADREAVLLGCIEKFLSIKTDRIRLNTDTDIARSSMLLEDIADKQASMLQLILRNQTIFNNLDKELQEKVYDKMGVLSNMGAYYRIRKQIITDPYYRAHYNSEVSRSFSVDDPVEKQRLTRLILIASGMKTQIAFSSRDVRFAPCNTNFDYINLGSDADTNQYNNLISHYDHISALEFGKNSHSLEQAGVHRDYLQTIVDEQNPEAQKIFQALYKSTITVNGVTSKESLFRGSAGLVSLKGISAMSHEQLSQFLNNLSSDQDQEKLEGLKTLRDLLVDHVKYLKGKYGNDLSYLHPTHLERLGSEITNDFVNNTNTAEALTYMLKVPEVAEGHKDEMLDALMYAGFVCQYNYNMAGATNTMKQAETPSFRNMYKLSSSMTGLSLLATSSSAVNQYVDVEGQLRALEAKDIGTSGMTDPVVVSHG
ncbi:MAG: hypothetical protein K6E19_07150 [Lachnospiraceae bacterium]|nr:hypothetical protein [Lachnospiraceae bacterium]